MKADLKMHRFTKNLNGMMQRRQKPTGKNRHGILFAQSLFSQNLQKNDVVRAFFPVAEQKVFESLPVILSDAKKTSALLDMALRELKAFELKYSTLSQLAPVFEAIKNVKKNE